MFSLPTHSAKPWRADVRDVKAFPWRSDYILKEPFLNRGLLKSGIFAAAFLHRVDALETEIRSYSLVDTDVRKLLGATDRAMSSGLLECNQPEQLANPRTEAKYSRYMLHLRLVDILADIEGVGQRLCKPKRIGSQSQWAHAHVLDSIKSTLMTFQNAVGLAVQRREDLQDRPKTPQDHLITNLRSFSHHDKLSTYSNVCINVLCAAITLQIMSQDLSIPEASKLEDAMSEEDRKLYASFFKKNAYRTRRPLTVAAFFSPIALLAGVRLDSNKTYPEIDMIKDSSTLGSPSSELLRVLEEKIWRCVSDVMLGHCQVEEAVAHLHRQLPYDQIQVMTDCDDQAYRLTLPEPKPATRSLIFDSLDSVNGAFLQTSNEKRIHSPKLMPPFAWIPCGPLLLSAPPNDVPSRSLEAVSPTQQSEGVVVRFAKRPRLDLEEEEEEEEEGGEDGGMPEKDGKVADKAMQVQEHTGENQEMQEEEWEAMDVDVGQEMQAIEPSGVIDSSQGASPHPPSLSPSTSQAEAEALHSPHRPECLPTPAPSQSSSRAAFPLLDSSVQTPAALNSVPTSPTIQSGRPKRNLPLPPPPPSAAVKASGNRAKRPPVPRTRRDPLSNPRKKPSPPSEESGKNSLKKKHWIRAITPFCGAVFGREDFAWEEPEGLDKFVAEPLNVDEITKYLDIPLPDASGQMHTHTIGFVDEDDHRFFKELMDSVQPMSGEDAQSGPQPYLRDKGSCVLTLSYEELKRMTARERIHAFATHHVLVTGCPHDDVEFDEDALTQFASLHTVHDIQGNRPQDARVTRGTLGQVIVCVRAKNCKPVSSLHHPMPHGTHDGGAAFSSDLRAFDFVELKPEGNVSRPLADMKWAIVGTAGTMHKWHVDSDGVATFIQTVTGTKLWFLLRGPGDYSSSTFSHPRLFNDPFAIDSGDMSGVINHPEVEMVILRPGTLLYMKSNEPHAVLTVEHAICYGGHFYVATAMQDTLSGIINALVRESYITNTSHPPLRMMIRQVVVYTHATLVRKQADNAVKNSHAFDAENLDMEAVKQIYAIIALGILSNLLDPRTYIPLENGYGSEYDYNTMPREERIGCTTARAMGYETWKWLASRYRINGSHCRDSHDFLSRQLAHSAFSLFIAKAQCEGEQSIKTLTLPSIRAQLLGLSISGSDLHSRIHQHLDNYDSGSLPSWESYVPDWDGLTLEKIDQPEEFCFAENKDLFWTGASLLDQIYYKAVQMYEPF